MAGPFYFAWCDAAELTTFGEAHHREDEDIFALEIAHAEGEFPVATLEIRNPRIGLLGPARKRFAWIAWRDAAGTVHPLFFGRLIGVPEDLQDDLVRLVFVARPVDIEAQKAEIAAALRELPWWDPLWFSAEERDDPDRVLEARPALWHFDRVTHAVTVSDIVAGEGATEEFGAGDAFHDSVGVTLDRSPAAQAIVEATVRWEQAGEGEIDVSAEVMRAFRDVSPATVKWIDGRLSATAGQIVIATGAEMLRAWPQPGRAIGGGWTVGSATSLKPIGLDQTPPVLLSGNQYAQLSGAGPGASPAAIAATFGRGPGLTVAVIDQGGNINPFLPFEHGPIDILWVPLWRMAGRMSARWQAARARTETVRFTLNADVQPILSEPGEEAVVRIALGPADADARVDPPEDATEPASEPGSEAGLAAPIGDRRRRSYFNTDRGRASLEHLIARARAHLIARARAVEVSFRAPFARFVAMSCRRSARLIDPRLPGGVAEGKVKSYALRMDGSTGELIGAATIACSIGRGGGFVAVPGTPSYVEDGYVAAGYQVRTGQSFALEGGEAGDVGYEDFSGQPIDDDGVDLMAIDAAGYVASATVTGGLITQQEEVAGPPGAFAAFQSAMRVVDRINAVETTVRLEMKPVTGGPFETVLEPALSPLSLPKTIDLEAL